MRVRLKNYKSIILGLSAVFVAVGVSGVVMPPSANAVAGTTRYVATGGTNSGDCSDQAHPCATIQYAVNQTATGDTVQVAAGTYNETVNITKSITLKGAQAGTDARNRSSSETVLKVPAGQTRGMTVSAPNVTINGFTIDGADGTNSIGIYAYNTTSNDLHIVNNVIKNNSNGVDLLGTDDTNLVIKQNLFDSNNLTGSGNGIYVAGSGSHGTNLNISDNTFRNTDDGTAGSTNAILINGTATKAIKQVTVTGNSSTNDGSFMYILNTSNMTISRNTVSEQAGNGVLVGDNVDTVTISDNTFKNSATGVKFSGATTPATNVTSTGNTITGMTTAGILILPDTIASGIAFSNNTITGNKIGLDNQSNVTVNANDNDWGCTAGPGHAGCDSVSGNVTVANWIGQRIPGVPNTGSSPLVSLVLMATAAAGIMAAGVLIVRKMRA